MNFLDKKPQGVLSYASKAVSFLIVLSVLLMPLAQVSAQGQQQIDPNMVGGQNVNVGTGAVTKAPELNTDALACSLTNPSVCLANVVYAFTVGLGSGLAYVGGFMLDTSVALSLNSAAYALSFLSSGWTTARDLANMAFILILVYIAFMIMFQAETAGTIRMLAWVVFIALIINFSFFFTRVVIDVGNILAVQFYNSIPGDSLQKTIGATSGQTGVLANTTTGIANYVAPQGSLANTKDLTASIMGALNIQDLFSDKNFRSFADQSSFGSKFIILSFIYLAIGACYFILAAMFFAVAVKFIVRVVVLWFLIIASPLAFICKAVPRPEVSAWYDRWQHELVSHAFYPAFFLFIFFFISTIMSTLGGSKGMFADMASGLNAAASNPNLGGFVAIASSIANVGIRLGFVVAMLYIALKASEYMGVKGGELAHSVTGWATRAGTGAVFGTAGWASRNTIGWAGQRFNTSTTGRNLAANGGLLGRTLWRSAGAIGRQSFDLRGAPGVRAGLGKLNIDTNGPGGQGGYTAGYAQRIANRQREAGLLAPSRLAIEEAEQRAIEQMESQTPGFAQRFTNAAAEFRQARDARDELGPGNTQEHRDAQARFVAAQRTFNPLRTQVNTIARTLAGSSNRGTYANSISQRSWRNLWGAGQGTPGWIRRADQEAAMLIRGNENDADRLHAIVGRMGFSAIPTPPAPPAPTTPPTPPTPPAPAGGGPAAGVAAGVAAGIGIGAAAGPRTPPTPPPSGGTPSNRPSLIIPPSDVATNPLSDAERAARFAPNTPPETPGPLPFSLRPSGPTSPISGGPGTSPPSSGPVAGGSRVNDLDAAGIDAATSDAGEVVNSQHELVEQMKGLRADVSNLQSAVNKPAPQSFVAPPKQAPWIPKSAPASFSAEQKSQIKGLITNAVEEQTEKLGEKLAAIKEDIDRKVDTRKQEEWLQGEAKRILGSIEKGDKLTTTEPTPAPPPPYEDGKKE